MNEDEFGTINVRREERMREIEALRQHYREHRTTLARLAAEAPTERLAAEYRRLIGDIDVSLAKIDELEPPPVHPDDPAMAATVPGRTVPGVPRTAAPSVSPAAPPHPALRGASPADQPLADRVDYDETVAVAPSSGGSRMLLIGVVALVALGVIGWLVWRAMSDRKNDHAAIVDTAPVVEPATPDAAPTETAPSRAARSSAPLVVSPASQDYGTIHKGTRATRQFEVANNSDAAVTIQIERSACRCLYYEYNGNIAAHGKETVTVTVDGAKAKAGQLAESLRVTTKKDPAVNAMITLSARIE